MSAEALLLVEDEGNVGTDGIAHERLNPLQVRPRVLLSFRLS